MQAKKMAILLSALVLPGLGQISLKSYKRGIAILVLVLFSVYKVMSIAMDNANAIVNKMMSQGGVLDMQAISNAAARSADTSSYDQYVWILIACWVISLLDIMFVARK